MIRPGMSKTGMNRKGMSRKGKRLAPIAGWLRDRSGGAAVLFAIMAFPMVGVVGLAIDYAMWNQTYSSMTLAASTAAINAVKIAAAGEAANDSNYLKEGVIAGQQWFNVQLSTYAGRLAASTPTVSLTGTTTITANVAYSSRMSSIFGSIFGVGSYPVTYQAAAISVTAPYLNVEILLDNSSSMAIGATTADIATLMANSPCDPSNAFYTSGQQSLDNYNSYQCVVPGGASGGTYDGTPPPACPIVAGGVTYTPISHTSSTHYGPSCKGQLPKQANGSYPNAGPPCAFACHWDGTKPAGQGNDLWAMARRNGVTLRFDLVKNATNAVIQEMQSKNNVNINNLGVGIFTFNDALNPVYPASPSPGAGEAGNNWTAALAAVGQPPSNGALTETGIQPVVGKLSNVFNNNSYFAASMNKLATTYLTPAGNGISATAPRKALFLITDGFEDDSARQAMQASVCQQFKNMGYTVYVVYTPYYPLMLWDYLNAWIPLVEGTSSISISYQLQACASSPANYISARDGPSLNAAVLNFLKQALIEPISYTK